MKTNQISKEEYNKNNYNFDLDMFNRTRDESILTLNRIEAFNEYNAYFEIYDKFINMPYEACIRVKQIKDNLCFLRGADDEN